jgi:hypothetical protein
MFNPKKTNKMNENKQEQKEREFKRKALGVIDNEKEMQLLQGPFKPNRALLESPFAYPFMVPSFCKKCGDHAVLTHRGVLLLEVLIELKGMEEVIPEDLSGYFVELEICPNCNPENESMFFCFRKIEEVSD